MMGERIQEVIIAPTKYWPEQSNQTTRTALFVLTLRRQAKLSLRLSLVQPDYMRLFRDYYILNDPRHVSNVAISLLLTHYKYIALDLDHFFNN